MLAVLGSVFILTTSHSFAQKIISNGINQSYNKATYCNGNLQRNLIFSQSKIAPFSVDTSDSWSVSWVDYDNDGNDDLFLYGRF